jgi:acyl transferase domain-containing protein
MATKALEQQGRATVLHCRNMNSYVSAALSDWGKQCALSASVARQTSPSTSYATIDARPTAGTSSFGMSGTNAHLLAAMPFAASQNEVGPAFWKRARYIERLSFFTLSVRNLLSRKLIVLYMLLQTDIP